MKRICYISSPKSLRPIHSHSIQITEKTTGGCQFNPKGKVKPERSYYHSPGYYNINFYKYLCFVMATIKNGTVLFSSITINTNSSK